MTLEQLNILRKLATDNKFGRGPSHANQVNKLSLRIYDGLTTAGMFKSTEGDRMILEAAALLHDIGLTVQPNKPHNEAAFDFLARVIPELIAADPLSDDDLSTLLYCLLWHRDSSFAKRGTVALTDPVKTRKMAAIIRVADALDRTLGQLVENFDMRVSGTQLTFILFSKSSIEIEIERAKEKSDLMKSAYGLTEVNFAHTEPKKNVLFVCGGNTCRSPMAKVILVQKLKNLGKLDRFEVESAAYDGPTFIGASDNARKAINQIFGQDLLASHKAKKLTPELTKKADLILVMAARMKNGLPPGKTWTLKEYAGGSGDVKDPFGGSLEVYLECASEISTALDGAVAKLL